MFEEIKIFLIYAYSANAIIASIGYVPQILKLIKDKTKSENFSISTWGMWVWTTLMTFSYALIVNGDIIFSVVSGTYFLGTFIIFALILFNRYFRSKLESI